MKPIVEKFLNDPSINNAIRVLKYARQHPMVKTVWFVDIAKANDVVNNSMRGE